MVPVRSDQTMFMVSTFQPWEKRLLWSVALIIAVLLVLYVLPRQKFLAARVREADCVVLTNRLQNIGVALVGNDVQKVIKSIRTSKRVLPWHKVESTGGYDFQFFREKKCVATVKTGWGIFWIGGRTYIDRTSSLDPIFEQVRTQRTQAR